MTIVPEVLCPKCGQPLVPPQVVSIRDRDLMDMLIVEFPSIWQGAKLLANDNEPIALSQIVRLCKRLIEISMKANDSTRSLE